jgi:hypothetical protein
MNHVCPYYTVQAVHVVATRTLHKDTFCSVHWYTRYCQLCADVLRVYFVLWYVTFKLSPLGVTTREHPAAEGETVGERCPIILP